MRQPRPRPKARSRPRDVLDSLVVVVPKLHRIILFAKDIKRMTEFFEAQRDPNMEPLSIEELKKARAEAWTHRHTRSEVEQ